MSSPWGTPPPSDPPSGPPVPPKPPVPASYGAPTGAYPGDGAPMFPPPPPAPPGPSGPGRRTAWRWVVGTVAALTVAAAITLTLVVTGDDDTSDDASPDTATSSTPDASTDASPDTGDEASPTTTPAPTPPADALVGDGYFYELPGIGWNDISDAKQVASAPTIDSMAALGTSFRNARANILVEAVTAGGISAPEDLESQWKRNVVSGSDIVPTDIADREIDGERAIGIELERDNPAGVTVRQRAYLVIHDGNQFSIAVSYAAGSDDIALADFEEALDSWRWTS